MSTLPPPLCPHQHIYMHTFILLSNDSLSISPFRSPYNEAEIDPHVESDRNVVYHLSCMDYVASASDCNVLPLVLKIHRKKLMNQ